MVLISAVNASGQTMIQCDQTIEGEFTTNVEEHRYQLTMEPREKFGINVKTAGDLLKVVVAVYGTTNLLIGKTGAIAKDPSISSGMLSAKGIYTIRVANANIAKNDKLASGSGGVGVYEMNVYCLKLDDPKASLIQAINKIEVQLTDLTRQLGELRTIMQE
jgi:hypothetical protein